MNEGCGDLLRADSLQGSFVLIGGGLIGGNFLGVTSFFPICFLGFFGWSLVCNSFFRKQAERFVNLRKASRVAYGEVRDPGKSVILVIFQKAACGICLFLISCLSKNMFYFFLSFSFMFYISSQLF